jgi:16S rRNA (cytosine967-C5)-methyltransferase
LTPLPPSTGLAARSAALKLLRAALSGRGGLEAALSDAGVTRLSPQDRAFARALAMVTLRRLGPIDRALDARLTREPPEPVRDLLRLGLAQAFWLETPNFAAVDTTVALAPKPMRGLVNAVLRGQLRDGIPRSEAEDLAPPWLYARWRVSWGEEPARAIARMIAEEPATDLSTRSAPSPELARALEAEILPGGGLRTRRRGDLATWPGFAEGDWWVQDAAAAIPARLLEPGPGLDVLDICAAPGGKTFQLAASGARVTALDRSPGRLARLSDSLGRLRLAAETVAADAVTWPDRRDFAAVLLDAPCSATGTFRRHPDVLWNARPSDIGSLAAAQAALLAATARRVRPGGVLVYGVCSLEPEEGEAQARAFLAHQPEFAPGAIGAGEGGAPAASLTPEGWLRVLPQHMDGGLDGFFVARFRRGA